LVPSVLADHVEGLTRPVEEVFPDAAAAMAQSLVAGTYYLVDHLPPPPPPSVFQGATPRPSTAEMEDFVRRYEAIDDPLSLLDRAADMSLTEAHVDAVRTVYPRLYEEMRGRIIDAVGDITTLPPYQARLSMGTLLGIDTDASLDGRFVFAMQQTYSQTNEAAAVQGQTSPHYGGVSESAQDTLTRAASVTHRI
jgi:hypothetical protein